MILPRARISFCTAALALTVCAAGVADTSAAGAGTAGPHQVDPGAARTKVHHIDGDSLRKGHAPRVLWVDRNVIHRPGHRPVHVRGLGKDLGIYGRSHGRYIVSDYNEFPTDLYRVGPRGRATRFYRTPDTICNTQLLAPRTGMLFTENARSGCSHSTIRRVNVRTGKVQRRLRHHVPQALLDVRGKRAVLGGRPRAQFWGKKGGTAAIAPGAAIFASMARNRFAIRRHGHVAMRRLDQPRRNLWRANGRLYPRDISPDGKRLVSLGEASKTVTVSRMRTGRPTDRFKIDLFRSPLEPESLQWESNRAFLLVYETDQQFKVGIMRCTLAGRCHRATRLVWTGDTGVDLVEQTPWLPLS